MSGQYNLKTPEFVSFENVRCPLGCPEKDEHVLVGHDRLHNLPGDFAVVKCSTCGLMRTNPRPTAASIGFYYPDDYGPYIGTRIEKYESGKIKNFLRPLVKWLFDAKTDTLPSMQPGRLLEVGCASGAFLDKMMRCGWQVEGIEFSEKAAAAAIEHGFKVHAGSLESAPAPDDPVDLIVGWMVLEHLHDPVGCLKKLNEWADSNAWLVLSVPNSESLEFKIFKDKWYALQLPTHLHHFTPVTIENILANGGWEVVKIHHQRSVINLLASIAYYANSKGWNKFGAWLGDFAVRGGKWFYILFPLAWTLSLFGQTGRMTVWARKVEMP